MTEKPSRRRRPRSPARGPAVVAVSRQSRALPDGYAALLADVKKRILEARLRASVAANRELLRLYWQVGRDIVQRQQRDGWGSSVIERLSRDLNRAFPGVEGLSTRNLWRMKNFFVAYPPAGDFLPQPVAESPGDPLPASVPDLPWGHIVILQEKVKTPEARTWYAAAAVRYGWTRNVLVHQIETKLHRRQGKAVTNFERTLPSPQSELAQQTLKDPYLFDFLTLAPEALEQELERGLVEHMRDFLLELGVGFAFVGSQYRLEVTGKTYYLDLLFYHLHLRCFVVIDLKMGEFIPEYAGKMSFYLSAVDEQLRHADDQPTVGIVLCKFRDKVDVEYTLRESRRPMGVATYRFTRALPPGLRGRLPSVQDLEEELGRTSKKETGKGKESSDK